MDAGEFTQVGGRMIFFPRAALMTSSGLSHGRIGGLVEHRALTDDESFDWVKVRALAEKWAKPHTKPRRAWSGTLTDIVVYGVVSKPMFKTWLRGKKRTLVRVPELTGRTKNWSKKKKRYAWTNRYRDWCAVEPNDRTIVIDAVRRRIWLPTVRLLEEWAKEHLYTYSECARGLRGCKRRARRAQVQP